MPKSDEFKFQAGAAPKAEREQRNEGGNHRDHTRHGTALAQKSLAVLDTSEFEHGQRLLPRPGFERSPSTIRWRSCLRMSGSCASRARPQYSKRRPKRPVSWHSRPSSANRWPWGAVDLAVDGVSAATHARGAYPLKLSTGLSTTSTSRCSIPQDITKIGHLHSGGTLVAFGSEADMRKLTSATKKTFSRLRMPRQRQSGRRSGNGRSLAWRISARHRPSCRTPRRLSGRVRPLRRAASAVVPSHRELSVRSLNCRSSGS